MPKSEWIMRAVWTIELDRKPLGRIAVGLSKPACEMIISAGVDAVAEALADAMKYSKGELLTKVQEIINDAKSDTDSSSERQPSA